ncbi:RNase H family protein [Tersicoccus sp. MR15.9]|uniref:RNase H family protein n=1 Tax=Tersicoccus mangrovi TaxID=3121635 RepID=UPI002FE54026
MNVIPLPTPPARRFVPAADRLATRTGVTIVLHRLHNLSRWAVTGLGLDGQPATLTGPVPGAPVNPNNPELAAQITAAVSVLSEPGQTVFASDHDCARLLREHTDLMVSDLSAPAGAVAAGSEAIRRLDRRIIANLTLACDASRATGGAVNGVGWVLAYSTGAEPALGSGHTLSPKGGILAGELSAIRKGLAATIRLHPSLADGAGSIRVITDSQDALALIARLQQGQPHSAVSGDANTEARRIVEMTGRMRIRFDWVRGHNGNTLNEFADRLAVLGRRNHEMGVDEVTTARMVAGIRREARECLTRPVTAVEPVAA